MKLVTSLSIIIFFILFGIGCSSYNSDSYDVSDAINTGSNVSLLMGSN